MKHDLIDVGKWITLGILASCGLAVGFLGIDYMTGQDTTFKAVCVDKVLNAGNSETAVGTVNGEALVIHTGHDDEWYLMVEALTDSREYMKAKASMNRYYHTNVGDTVTITRRFGGITKAQWGTTAN